MYGLKSTVTPTVAKDYFWFEYWQNNSGGDFVINDSVSVKVLIQAENADMSDVKAESIGIYFDGCHNGQDCPCCGDRWSTAYKPLDEFSAYSWKQLPDGGHYTSFDNVVEYAQALANEDDWAEVGCPSVIVYFANGDKKLFYKNK